MKWPNNNPTPGYNQTRWVRHVTETNPTQDKQIDKEESIDPESFLYWKKRTENWINQNLVRPPARLSALKSRGRRLTKSD